MTRRQARAHVLVLLGILCLALPPLAGAGQASHPATLQTAVRALSLPSILSSVVDIAHDLGLLPPLPLPPPPIGSSGPVLPPLPEGSGLCPHGMP